MRGRRNDGRWRCGHERTPENTRGVSAQRPGGQCRACNNATRARYLASEKGRAKQARYLASEKGRAKQARYRASEKGRAVKARYDARRYAKPQDRMRRIATNYKRRLRIRIVAKRVRVAQLESILKEAMNG